MRSGESQPKQGVGVVYAVVFLDLLGFGILLPSLPYWARTLGASGLELGLLLSAYSVAQFFGSPLFGRISDRVGRRPVLLWSLAGSVLTMALSAVAPTLLALIAARFLAGFFAASIGTAQAYLVDVTPADQRAKYMGLLGAAIGMGFVLGPALGAALAAMGYGFRVAALTSSALAFATLLVAWQRLREPERHRERTKRSLRTVEERPFLLPLLVANFLLTGVFVMFETTFAFLGADRFGLREVGFGLTLFGIGMVMVVVQGSMIGRATTRFGNSAVALGGAALLLLGIVGVPFAASLVWVLPPLVLVAVGRGFTQPTLTTILSLRVSDARQGEVLGLSQSFAAAARALVPVGAGAAYDASDSLPYWIGAGFCAAALLLIAVGSRSKRKER